jgi:hypothetical protein
METQTDDYGLEIAPEIPVTLTATIAHRRRGIWLCNCSEDEHGTEEWDAYGTLAEAKRWCAEWCGVKRLRWTEYAPGAWIAQTTTTRDN